MIITNEIFAKTVSNSLLAEKKWVCALSGGADSLCLTMIANEFAKNNRIELTACFVDHKLRPESSTEILPIIELLKKNNIQYKVLSWENKPGKLGNIQKRARDARYNLLFEFCNEIGASVLMTGHHMLDQWETFFMRLSKGAGLRGMSCIESLYKVNGIYLFRPLLPFSPDDIKQTLVNIFGVVEYVNDPSNDKEKYERVRWRKRYIEMSKYGLDMQNVFKSISRLKRAHSCLDDIANQGVCEVYNGEYINRKLFNSYNIEIKIRMLNIILSKYATIKNRIISDSLLEKTAVAIAEDGFRACNLAGVVLKKDKTKNILVYREMRHI